MFILSHQRQEFCFRIVHLTTSYVGSIYLGMRRCSENIYFIITVGSIIELITIDYIRAARNMKEHPVAKNVMDTAFYKLVTETIACNRLLVIITKFDVCTFVINCRISNK